MYMNSITHMYDKKLHKKKSSNPKTPSDETVQFILNYSKSLNFMKLKQNDNQIELHLN